MGPGGTIAAILSMSGVIASVAASSRIAHRPVTCDTSVSGRGPRSPVAMRHSSGRAGRMAIASASVRRVEKAPVRSRQSASDEGLLMDEVTRLSTLKARVWRVKFDLVPLNFA